MQKMSDVKMLANVEQTLTSAIHRVVVTCEYILWCLQA